jgi:hypothetical protein
MKYPKLFNKLTPSEQEQWLVNKLQDIYDIEQDIKIALGKIRGGEIVLFKEVDRLDLLEMKDED